MRQEQTKYEKRLVFPKIADSMAFLGTYMESEVSCHFRATVAPLIREVPLVGKVRFQEVRLKPVSDVSFVQAQGMELLDASLLDGMLRQWKENLVPLEDPVPAA